MPKFIPEQPEEELSPDDMDYFNNLAKADAAQYSEASSPLSEDDLDYFDRLDKSERSNMMPNNASGIGIPSPKISNIDELAVMGNTEGVLNHIFAFLNTTVSGIGTIATVAELGKKRYIQEMVREGKVNLSEEDMDLISNSSDTDWSIQVGDIKEPANYYPVYSTGLKYSQVKGLQVPLYAKVNVKKTYKKWLGKVK
jgi:hypothetical protein